MIDEDDKRGVMETLAEMVNRVGGLSVDDVLKEPLVFTNLNQNCNLYKSVDPESFKPYLQGKVDKLMNEGFCDDEIVVFDEVVENILKVKRILDQPFGHVLMVGLSGTGKTMVVKIVKEILEYDEFVIHVDEEYDVNRLDEDLTELFGKMAEEQDKHVIFTLDESQIVSVAFLERMNSLLASGEIPGLFSDAKKREILSKFKSSSRDEDEKYREFIECVQHHLHIVLSMNPSGDGHKSTASSPAVYNRCTIIWMGDWSQKSYLEVARSKLREIDLLNYCKFQDSKIKPELALENLCQLSFGAFCETLALNKKLKEKQLRYNYSSPIQFVDFLNQLKNWYLKLTTQLQDDFEFHTKGLEKFQEISESVSTEEAAMKIKDVELKNNIEILEKKEQELKEKQEKISVLTEDCERKESELESVRNEVSVEKKIVEEKVLEIKKELDEASEKVNNISNNDIATLKSTVLIPKHFPKVEPVLKSFIALCTNTVLTEQADIKKQFSQSSLIKAYIASEKNIRSETIEASRKMLQGVKAEEIKRLSSTVLCFLEFSEAKVNYVERKDKLMKENSKLKAKVELLEENDRKIEKNQSLIKQLTEDKEVTAREMAKMQQKLDKLQKEIDDIKLKLQVCKDLIEGFRNEREAWGKHIEHHADEKSLITIKSIYIAYLMVFYGFYDSKYRDYLSTKLDAQLEHNGIEVPENWVFKAEDLVTQGEKKRMSELGLANDSLSVVNAFMIENKMRFPYIIDPTGSIFKYIKNKLDWENVDKKKQDSRNVIKKIKKSKEEATSLVLEKKNHDANFKSTMKSSMEFGHKMLVSSCEQINMVMSGLISTGIDTSYSRPVQMFKEKINIDPNFDLYLFAGTEDVHLSPYIASKVMLVNFSITNSYIQNTIRLEILKSEEFAVYEQVVDTRENIEILRSTQEDNKKKLLHILSSSDNIIENLEVIQTLKSIQEDYRQIEDKREVLEGEFENFESKVASYDPLAKKVIMIWFLLENLNVSSNMYRFRYVTFKRIVDIALQNIKAESEQDSEVRKTLVLKQIIRLVYEYVSPSLHERHKSILLLRLVEVAIQDEHADLLNSFYIDHRTIKEEGLEDFKYYLDFIEKDKLLNLLHLENVMTCFVGVKKSLKAEKATWVNVFSMNDPENYLPDAIFNKAFLGMGETWIKTLLKARILLVIRPDKFKPLVRSVFSSVLGINLLEAFEYEKYTSFINDQSKEPILIIAAPGMDIEGHLHSWNKDKEKIDFYPVGKASIKHQIRSFLSAGRWVVFKNGHLDPEFLKELKNALEDNSSNPHLRVFVTAENPDKVQNNFLEYSHKMVFEKSTSIQENMISTWTNFTGQEQGDNVPNFYRILFGVTVLHNLYAIRDRFRPFGWLENYEYGQNDLKFIFKMVNEWLNDKRFLRGDDTCIKILKGLFENSVYGAKINSKFDYHIMTSFSSRLVNEQTLTSSIQIDRTTLNIGNVTSYAKGFEELKNLNQDEINGATWVGLDTRTEKKLAALESNNCYEIIRRLHVLEKREFQSLEGDDSGKAGGVLDGVLKKVLSYFEELVDKNIDNMVSFKDKQLRIPEVDSTLRNELVVFETMFAAIRKDVLELKVYLEQHSSHNSYMKTLTDCLLLDTAPPSWLGLIGAKYPSFSVYLASLLNRFNYWRRLSNNNFKRFQLGCLNQPDAMLICLRQVTASRKQIAFEKLIPQVTSAEVNDDSYCFVNLTLEMFDYSDNTMTISNTMEKIKEELWVTFVEDTGDKRWLQVPLYLQRDRDVSVFELYFHGDQDLDKWYNRGVAVICDAL